MIKKLMMIALLASAPIFFPSQAMEPSYKTQKAALKEARLQALEAQNRTEYQKLFQQTRELRWNNALKKAHATEIDAQFIKAIEANDAKSSQELLNSGANVNIKWYGKPALIHALSHENLNKALIEALLNHPLIDVNAKDKKGSTALREVQKMRLTEAPSRIANINNVPSGGSVLLDIAKNLIERPDTNLNATYEHRRTVFTQAIYDLHDKPLIELLLSNGCKKPTNTELSAHYNGSATYFSLLPPDILTHIRPFVPAVAHVHFLDNDQFSKNALFYLTANGDSSTNGNPAWHSRNFEMAHERAYSISYREELKDRIEAAVVQQLLITNNLQ